MSRRGPPPVGPYPAPPPSKCAKVLYYSWRLCSVLFAHLVMISLVVAYCILGAVTFERLEAQHEKEVKQNISFIRQNTTHSIWSMTNSTPVLAQGNWTRDVTHMLKDFENAILLEMKVRGWDGNESTDHIQWTFTGALFYSIIVITTIGYGHIAPKTQTGKVVTIVYAILGIPLMLLCLSNIGDVMASSFRFLYWRVCCYVCTRPPKRQHRHRQHTSLRRSVRGSRRRRPPPGPLQRAHSDTDCRYRDSGYGSGRGRRPARASSTRTGTRTRSQPPAPPYHYHAWETGPRDFAEERSPDRYDRHRDNYDEVEDEFPRVSLPLHDLEVALKELEEHQQRLSLERTKSLPTAARARARARARASPPHEHWPRDHQLLVTHDQSLPGAARASPRRGDCEPQLFATHDLHDVDYDNYKERKARELEEIKREDYCRYRESREHRERERWHDPDDEDVELDAPRRERDRARFGDDHRYRRVADPAWYPREVGEFGRGRRARSAYECGWEGADEGTHREGRRMRRLRTVDDSRTRRYTPSPELDPGDWSEEEAPPPRRSCPPPAWDGYPTVVDDIPTKEQLKPVPIWLCTLLVGGYIVAGTFMFRSWEGWAALDAAYFCFITLTTIGFGDFVPAQGVRGEEWLGSSGAAAVNSLALCALYVLLGIALLAMAFNLVQEEVRAHVAALATKLGIIKRKAPNYY